MPTMATSSFGKNVVQRLTDFAEALGRPGPLPQRFARRRMALSVKPARYTPKLVRKTRSLLGVSQALFAQFLGVSVKTVHAWEQGITMPSDIARRFMDEIRHDPAYWCNRLGQAVVTK